MRVRLRSGSGEVFLPHVAHSLRSTAANSACFSASKILMKALLYDGDSGKPITGLRWPRGDSVRRSRVMRWYPILAATTTRASPTLADFSSFGGPHNRVRPGSLGSLRTKMHSRRTAPVTDSVRDLGPTKSRGARTMRQMLRHYA